MEKITYKDFEEYEESVANFCIKYGIKLNQITDIKELAEWTGMTLGKAKDFLEFLVKNDSPLCYIDEDDELIIQKADSFRKRVEELFSREED